MATIELPGWRTSTPSDDTASARDWGHSVPRDIKLTDADILAFWKDQADTADTPDGLRPRRFAVDAQAVSAMVDWAIAQDFAPNAGEHIRDDAWH